MNTKWWVDCGREKGGKNASSTEEARGEWRMKGRKTREKGENKQEGGKKIAGRRECGWNGGKSKREEERFPLAREGEERVRQGRVWWQDGRASERSSERTRAFGKTLHGEGG